MRGLLEQRRQRERKGKKRQQRRRRRLHFIDFEFLKPAPRARAGEAVDARRGGPGRGRIRRRPGGAQSVSFFVRVIGETTER